MEISDALAESIERLTSGYREALEQFAGGAPDEIFPLCMQASLTYVGAKTIAEDAGYVEDADGDSPAERRETEDARRAGAPGGDQRRTRAGRDGRGGRAAATGGSRVARQLSAEGSLIEVYRNVVNLVNAVERRDARLTTTSPNADKPQRVAAVGVARSGHNVEAPTHKGCVVLRFCTFPDFVTNSI